VYVHYLTRELVALGHHVEVFSGPPYPRLAPGVPCVEVPSLDLYRPEDPFRTPALGEFRDLIDVAEFATMCAAGFPEPLTYSLRARRVLRSRRGDFDVVHDNQCLGYGVLGIARDGLPVVATVHHPITVDRTVELAHAAADGWRRQLSVRRWYGFVRMQKRVARRIPRVITVSESSAGDISAQMGVRRDRMSVVPVGVDTGLFRPLPHVARVPGRLMTTASADVPLKGLVPLLEALAKVRTERHAELVVVGQPRDGSLVPATIERLGLEGAVTIAGVVDNLRMVELYAEAEVAVVPSLYEGFSLPAVEAMACGLPLVTTTGGALPEVVGADGDCALLVPPNDPGALAGAIVRALDDSQLRARMGAAGRARVLDRFTWRATAEATVDVYREVTC
ncbi:MAG TPA: glycosyltransferase family 4 protein, partial [Acidimicrobiales bacterium]|nr:glycosyltransferase family 4 protein [Acidimicrobiales bacterium]